MWQPLPANEARDRLIIAAASHVPFDGWTQKAVLTGADDIGMAAEEARRIFPDSAEALVVYHTAFADRRMGAAVQALLSSDTGADMGVRQRIAAAVKIRLDQNASQREAVRAAFAVLAFPHNGPVALACLYRTVDTVWFAIGDTSTDFNFYSRRLLLSGVYLSTLLYWLNDNSEESKETWGFLDRRIADVMRIERAKGRLRGAKLPFADLLKSLRQGMSGRKGTSGYAPRPGYAPSAPPASSGPASSSGQAGSAPPSG